jgi:hypothetical protein
METICYGGAQKKIEKRFLPPDWHPFSLFNKNLALTFAVEDDSHNEAIDTEDTRHDNGDDGLEDQVGLEDTHATDADA